MGLQITILESAQLGVTIVEPFNVTLTPTAPATIDIEVGVPGASASVTVGTTTTLAPGLNATVTNVGTSTNAILDFGIPAGEQGIQGIQGIQGPAGTSGVVYATAPLSYNSGTQTISIDLSAYATQAFVTSQGYITASALTPYLTSATAAATYYPLTNPSNFITVSALAGYATESWVTSQNYLTTADLTGYATESWVTSQGYITDAPSDGETYARKNAAWEIIGGGSYLPLAGGTMDANANIYLSTATYDSLVNGEVFGVELSADPTQNASLSFNAVTVQDGAGSMQMLADGLTFPDATTQTTAGLSPATAAATYYPLTNPAGYITASALTGYATESWVTSQGYLTDAPSDTYGYVRKAGAWSYSPKFFEVQVGASTNITSGQYLIADGSFVTNITAADIILSTAAGVGMRLTDASITFADSTVQSTAGLSPATAAATYAPIAAAVPVGGATGQVLTKTSGTDYALSWETPVVGDRYLTSSTTSNTIGNGNKTFTIGTGLSYTTTQNITISFDASNHMHGEVLTYNSGTGVLTVDINHHTGAGTYASWVVNVGGVTPATSVAWGDITGTLSDQTDLQSALNAKANLASPTFTGTVTIPAGASISGYSLLASPTFTGDPKAPTPLLTDNDTSIATTAYVKGQGYLSAATAAGTYYPLTNPSNFVIPNGTTSIQVTGGTVRSIDGSDNFTSLDGSALNFGNLGTGVGGLSVTGTGITYADSTVQTTAGIGDAPSDGSTYGRNNGAWVIAGGGGGSGTLSMSSGQLYDTSTAFYVDDLTVANARLDTAGLTLTASSGAVITFPDTTTQSTAPHDLPIGGTTGQVLTKNSATDYDASWATASGGGGGTNIQSFGDAGSAGTFTWTKPAGAKMVHILMISAGSGGGSGAVNATSAIRTGGAGAGGGSVFKATLPASLFNNTETVVVGAGGAGGASTSTNSTAGNAGTSGGNTSFGLFRAAAANGAVGGSLTSQGGGSGVRLSALDFAPVYGNGGGLTSSGVGTTSTSLQGTAMPAGGGAGGAGSTANSLVNRNGGTAGNFIANLGYTGLNYTIAGGAGGIASPATLPTNGTSSTNPFIAAGTGGGSGAYITGQPGQKGGNGGWPGGSGGGGSGADNSSGGSGAGGSGANGYVVVITYS